MKKHYRKESNCLNCGTNPIGKYCQNCGQENLEIKESFGHMMTHAISDYFHFDHQFFHTLKPLLFKPGKLTNEYMAGKRVQYLHPVKMYIFISLIYFLLLFKEDKPHGHVEHKIATKDQVTGQDTKPGEKGITFKDKSGIIQFGTGQVGESTEVADKDTTYAQYLQSQKKLPASEKDNIFERYFRKKKYDWTQPGLNSREILQEGLKHNFPKLMFLLLPILAWILSVAFRSNRKFYVEHLIYSFHLYCFLFLFLSFVMILKLVFPPEYVGTRSIINIFAVVTIIWYLLTSVKVVYQRSWFRTVTKSIGVSLMYLLSFLVCVLALVLITAIVSL